MKFGDGGGCRLSHRSKPTTPSPNAREENTMESNETQEQYEARIAFEMEVEFKALRGASYEAATEAQAFTPEFYANDLSERMAKNF